MSKFDNVFDAEIVHKTGMPSPGEFEPDLPDVAAPSRPAPAIPLFPTHRQPCFFVRPPLQHFQTEAKANPCSTYVKPFSVFFHSQE